MKHITMLALAAILLAGCGASATPTPTVTETVVQTPTDPPPEPVAEPTPTDTTPEPSPTDTPETISGVCAAAMVYWNEAVKHVKAGNATDDVATEDFTVASTLFADEAQAALDAGLNEYAQWMVDASKRSLDIAKRILARGLMNSIDMISQADAYMKGMLKAGCQ